MYLSLDLLYRSDYIIVKKEIMESKPRRQITQKISAFVRDIKSEKAPSWIDKFISKVMDQGDKRNITEYSYQGHRITVDYTHDKKDPLMTIDFIYEPKVYVIQEISGTRHGAPKINIMGAQKYGEFLFCLPEMSQIIFSPGPLIFRLREKLKHYRETDYLLLTGDPAIIGVACSIVSDITNGKYKLLKWDKQERKYYPIEINLHEKGNKDE